MRLVGLRQRLRAPALLAPHEVDGAPVHERQDPGARLRPLGHEPAGGAPDGEEGLLHRVLRERLVAQHAEREAVGDAAEAVVQLGERDLVRAGDEGDDGFVGEVREGSRHHRIFAHRSEPVRPSARISSPT